MSPDLVLAEAPGHLGPVSSFVLVFGLLGGLGAILASAIRRWAREHAQARQAKASGEQCGELLPGPAIVFGKVEFARDEKVAARVEIDQDGTESESSGSYSWSWKEKDRRVTMRPFYVRVSPRDRVRIEPGERAFLVDAMDGMVLVNSTLRRRTAELTRGEAVFAVGKLAREHDPESLSDGYRSAAQGWVMRAPPGEDLLLSSEPLETRYLRRARGQAVVAWLAVLFIALAAGLNAPYLASFFTGREVTATVVEKIEGTDSEGDRFYKLDVLPPGGERVQFDITGSGYNRVSKDSKVRVRYVPWWPWASDLGDRAGVSFVVIYGIGLLIGMFFIRRAVTRRYLSWYESDLVESGSGKLADNVHTTRM